jgi:hypothetical protein
MQSEASCQPLRYRPAYSTEVLSGACSQSSFSIRTQGPDSQRRRKLTSTNSHANSVVWILYRSCSQRVAAWVSSSRGSTGTHTGGRCDHMTRIEIGPRAAWQKEEGNLAVEIAKCNARMGQSGAAGTLLGRSRLGVHLRMNWVVCR